MNKNFTTYQKIYKQGGRIFNYFWITLSVVAFGLLVMNLVQNNDNPNQDLILPGAIPPECRLTSSELSRPIIPGELETLFELSLVDTNDIHPTNYRKDSIPYLEDPQKMNFDEAGDCLNSEAELVAVTLNNQTVLYPRLILNYHLVINDTVGGVPIAVTYCPLCDTVRVYERNAAQNTLRLGHSGLLYKNNDLIYDSDTESLWSQYTGQALIGTYTGAQLRPLSFSLIKFSDALEIYPQAKIVSFATGYALNYFTVPSDRFFQSDQVIAPIENVSAKLRLKEKILGIKVSDEYVAVALKDLETFPAVFDFNGGEFVIYSENLGYRAEIDGEPVPGEAVFNTLWYVWFDYFPQTALLD